MSVQLFNWQEQSCAQLVVGLQRYGVVADGSEMGTGKTVKACFAAKLLGKPLFVVCPKSVIPDWQFWAGEVGVPITVINYERLRTGKSGHGVWAVKNKVFEMNTPNDAIVVWDEAHRLGGRDTQNSRMLVAAVRQKIPMMLLSGTLLENPLKGQAIGFALGLHRMTNFWQWAREHGVSDGIYGPVWQPKNSTGVMESIRVAMGERFTRIRKADVPGFPHNQIVPTFVQTEEMPDLASDYGMEARAAVELLKVPSLIDKAKELVSDFGHSVTIFVNFIATLNALIEAFPEAAIIRGGQSSTERVTNLNRFQNNEAEIALVMAQAGGTGVSFHDLHGRPRSSLVCPGWSATEFLQVLARIHRAGAKSDAINYVILASGVPIERRIRSRLDEKLNDLSALNDYDLAAPGSVTNHNNATDPTTATPHAPGALSAGPGASPAELPDVPNECPLDQAGQSHGRSGTPDHPSDHDDRGGSPSPGGSAEGPAPGGSLAGSGSSPVASSGDGRSSGQAQEALDNSAGRRSEGAGPDGQPATRNPADPMVKVLLTPEQEAVNRADSIGSAMAARSAAEATEAPLYSVTPAAPAADATGNHVVRKHARCSPSKLKNLEICPSYSGDNDGPVHPITLRGTAMHEALETGDDSKLDPRDTEGVNDPDAGEEKRLVNMCREFQDGEAVPGELVITEPHLKTHDRDVQGFADRVVLEPVNPATGKRRARIRDYKMGFNLVDLPDVNPQAIAYTVAIFLEYADVDEVDFAFLIPRLDAILQHTFKREDLPELMLRLSVIADRVRKLAGKVHNKNNDNCLYCGNKATCPAMVDTMLPIARGYDEAEKLPLPATFNPSQIVDPKQMAYALNMARIAQAWAEAVNSYALKFRLELGMEIPGYDLIERSAKREIVNAVGAWKIINEEFGVPLDEYLATLKPSITKLETVVKDRAAQGDKAKAAELMTDRLLDEGLLTRGASFHVLAKSKKKAVKTVTA